MVKCLYCGKNFDKDKEPCEKVNGTRYAHLECCENSDDYWIKKIKAYAAQALGVTYKPIKTGKDLKRLHDQLYLSYKVIYDSLTYWYDVKKESPEKAYGGINIVEYIWQEAKDYYDKAEIIKENTKYNLKDFVLEDDIESIKVKWEPPVRPKNYGIIDLR